MKLVSCHIDNFGKLSDLSIDFTDGVNLFHEPNAWGKSTLAAFLRVMFYGFDSKKESGSFDLLIFLRVYSHKCIKQNGKIFFFDSNPCVFYLENKIRSLKCQEYY